jgi:hypothetical protein
MKFNFLFLLLAFPFATFGQYSSYYGRYDVNSTVNVTGSVTKTINTIDYGSLALANAEREKNRLQSLQYTNELDKQHAIEIALNPMKAFDYGVDNTWEAKVKEAQVYGFTKFTQYHKIPHPSLFVRTQGYNYRNVSDNNIVTEIELIGAININGLKDETLKNKYLEAYKVLLVNPEEYAKFDNHKVGTDIDGIFLHRKDINKAKVFNIDGFKGTMIYEDKYEIVIKDNYYASINGVIFEAGVRYKGDKDEVNFEDLEGRRYYLKKLCEQIIATSYFKDVK